MWNKGCHKWPHEELTEISCLISVVVSQGKSRTVLIILSLYSLFRLSLLKSQLSCILNIRTHDSNFLDKYQSLVSQTVFCFSRLRSHNYALKAYQAYSSNSATLTHWLIKSCHRRLRRGTTSRLSQDRTYHMGHEWQNRTWRRQDDTKAWVTQKWSAWLKSSVKAWDYMAGIIGGQGTAPAERE